RRRHTRSKRDWSSDVCSSDLPGAVHGLADGRYIAGHAGGCFVMHDANRLDLVARICTQPLFNGGGVCTPTPITRHEFDTQAQFISHPFPEQGKMTGFSHENQITL